MSITYTISLSVAQWGVVVVRYITIPMYVYIDLLAAHNDEGCPDKTYMHIFQVSAMPRKRPACIIAIMDNSRDLKTHTKCRLNERLNQAPQISSFSLSLSFSHLILKIIDLFSLSLFIHQSTQT